LNTARKVEKVKRKDFVKGIKIAKFLLINSIKTRILLREEEDS
jgi:hypothetical protein